MTPTRKAPHPALFGLLLIPFGMVSGYGTNAMPYLLEHHGVELATIGTISAFSQSPHAYKFFWSPLLDIGIKRRTWFVLTTLLAAVALALTLLVPISADGHIGPFKALTVYEYALAAAMAGVATASSAVDALMATSVPDAMKGRAAGWRYAGNLGGTGLGGMVGTWLSTHTSPLVAASVIVSVMIATGAPVFLVDEVAPERHAPKELFVRLFKDVWSSLTARDGWTGLVICLSPIGTAAASCLYTALATAYNTNETTVDLWINGAGGAVSALGCVVGGYIADRMNRRLLYVIAGIFVPVGGVVMSLGSATSTNFVAGILVYNFMNGIAWAAFGAFVLEMVGHGTGVATKYALFVSAANLASTYMTWVEGEVGTRAKEMMPNNPLASSLGIFGIEFAMSVVGALVIGAMTYFGRRATATDVVPGAAAQPEAAQ